MRARVGFAHMGVLMTLVALGSCGGGGGGEAAPAPVQPSCSTTPFDFVGVCTGFTGDLDWQAGGDGSGGVGDGGASGDGGVGAGGDFGQFRGATVNVYKEDGSLLGTALTDINTGMVTIRPGRSYRGALRVELRGGPGASYFEEGKNEFVPFPADRSINVIVRRIDKNIGATAFTEAAYRLLTEGSTAERATGIPTPAQILAANERVRGVLNQQFPSALQVDDITRLPFIKSPSIPAGTISTNPRGRYGLVNGAFSKQAAMYNPGRSAPTLDAVAQLATDLLDGQLDGRNTTAPATAADQRTYDPNTLAGELSSALAHQAKRFGSTEAFNALPKVLNFGNTRYEGYLFDGTVTRDRRALSTVAGWVAGNSLGLSLGSVRPKSAGGQDVYGMYGNFGHGGAFFKSDPVDNPSQGKIYALGDNVNGELGVGNTTSTNGGLVEITLPAGLTHAAGGFAHTVARLANGTVYTWGDNSYGQLGQGLSAAALPRSTTPVRVPLPAGVVAVAATSAASYALMADGTVYAWGSNGGFGLLGNGARDSTVTSPALVNGLGDAVQISARDNDVAVLRRDNTLWQWGSFPAPDNAFTPGDPGVPYAGGNLTPTELPGLQAALGGGVTVRKVLSEQGLVVALLSNGHVYTWGVYFDLTAGAILRDLQATRVLGLPPLRDIMPGGFNGYGVRPFDRNTAMGIDYRGGMWKVRGRVAEQFDPDSPAQQRRPQVQSPRPDCASCHLFLSDWPLTPAAPTSTVVCTPPSSIHGSGSNTLIHAETQSEQCHNPARNPPIAAFPNGWLACVRPTNLPPRPTVVAPPQTTTACQIPPRHTFTPPGTVCASCHNSVLATPLSQLNPPCAQPQSIDLPTLPATATISAIVDDARTPSVTLAQGAFTADTSPQLSGTLSVALSGSQALAVSRNGTLVGNALASGTGWSFTDSGAPQGLVSYTVRVVQGSSFGATSNAYAIRVDSVPPLALAQVTGFTDATFGPIASGGFATDTRPTISGTLSVAVGAGEEMQLLRNGQFAGIATVSGTSWSFVEPSALTPGSYAYSARVRDPADNIGNSGASFSVTLLSGVPTATIASITNDANAVIAAGSITSDATPTLNGSLSAALPSGHLLRVLRNGSSAGLATVSGSSWNLTDSAPQGAASYTARVEAGAVLGAASAAYAISIDSIAPTQTADVTGIADDYIGALAAGASTADQTPTVSGTLSVALGSGEELRLLRQLGSTTSRVQLTPTPSGTGWSYTEPALLNPGTYTYQAQVFDAAGNNGALGATRTVTIDLSAVPLPGAAATLATINGVAPSGGAVPLSNINTPVLAGTIARALNAGEVVRVYRNGAGFAATVTGQNWSYTNTTLVDGSYAFFARVERPADSAFGSSSATVNATIDATLPTQTATIGGIFDDASVSVGGNNTTDSTPRIAGTLNSGLGAGETVEVVRSGGSGTVTQTATLSGGTTWSLQEGTALAASSYSYTVRVRDLAGNRGANSSLSVTVIAPLPSVSTIQVAYSAGLAAPRADGTVVASGGSIADTTPTVQGTIASGLPGGASIRLYRSGTTASIGTATPAGTSWSFVDADVGQGTRSYTARVENGTAYGSPSGSYTVTVDTVAPAQTVGILNGQSFVMPNTQRPAGSTALPVNFVIPASGQTNDPNPVLVVQLAAPLGSDILVILRNGVEISRNTNLVSDTCTNCYRVLAASGFSIPAPATTPNTASHPIGSATYTARIEDAAGNFVASSGFSVTFAYFDCDIARANATYGAFNAGAAHPAWSGSRCAGCHSATNTAVGATPAGTLVSVPRTTATYWCRRP